MKIKATRIIACLERRSWDGGLWIITDKEVFLTGRWYVDEFGILFIECTHTRFIFFKCTEWVRESHLEIYTEYEYDIQNCKGD